jgi:hypothetical protein
MKAGRGIDLPRIPPATCTWIHPHHKHLNFSRPFDIHLSKDSWFTIQLHYNTITIPQHAAMSSRVLKRKRSSQAADQEIVMPSVELQNVSIKEKGEEIPTMPSETKLTIRERAIATSSEYSSFDSTLLLPEPPYYEQLPEQHPIRRFWDTNYPLFIILIRQFLERECTLARQCDLATLWEEEEKGIYLAVFLRDDDVFADVHKKLEEPLKVLVNHIFEGSVKGPLFWRIIEEYDEQSSVQYGDEVERTEEEMSSEDCYT